jgi:hypothetical protein
MTTRFAAAAYLLAIMTGGTAAATGVNVWLEAEDCSASIITAAPGCAIPYRVVAELTDDANLGLAMAIFDLEFSGGSLTPVQIPFEPPMNAFLPPAGFSNNPLGFGGTPAPTGLIQVGGVQNVFSHGAWPCSDDDDCPGTTTCQAQICEAYPGLPLGSVVTGIARPGSPVVLARGTAIAPAAEGVHTIAVENLNTSVIEIGSTGNPWWDTAVAQAGQLEPLVVYVVAGASCCTPGAPDLPAVPALTGTGAALLIILMAGAGIQLLMRR